jgi:hypothetical protein
MPQIRLVERMTEAPPSCLTCGKGNVPDGETKEVPPAIDLGADVNWGDSTYLCESCATTVGSLVGMLTPDEVQEFKQNVRKLKKKVHDLEAELEAKARSERQAIHRARSAEALAS